MARRIIGVSKRLIEVARQEFIDCGFEGASIRTIAQKAETSPRAIYTRFKNKEELFAAVVGPVLSDFMKSFFQNRNAYWERAKNHDSSIASQTVYKTYLNFAYSHREDFLLILQKSQGTRFDNFTGKLAQYDLRGVRRNAPKLLKTTGFDEKKPAINLFYENITKAFYHNLFEPLIQGLSLEEAYDYVDKLTQFYESGLTYFIEA